MPFCGGFKLYLINCCTRNIKAKEFENADRSIFIYYINACPVCGKCLCVINEFLEGKLKNSRLSGRSAKRAFQKYKPFIKEVKTEYEMPKGTNNPGWYYSRGNKKSATILTFDGLRKGHIKYGGKKIDCTQNI